MMSSFFWTSPCTFSVPAVPIAQLALVDGLGDAPRAQATTSSNERSSEDVRTLHCSTKLAGEADAFLAWIDPFLQSIGRGA